MLGAPFAIQFRIVCIIAEGRGEAPSGIRRPPFRLAASLSNMKMRNDESGSAGLTRSTPGASVAVTPTRLL